MLVDLTKPVGQCTLSELERPPGFEFPDALLLGTDDQVYVSNIDNGLIHRFNARNGQYMGILNRYGSEELRGPAGLALDPRGRVLVAAQERHQIFALDANDGTCLGSFCETNLHGPAGLAWGADGCLYVANSLSNDVVRINPLGGSEVFTKGDYLHEPWGVAFGPDGNLYVASFKGNAIARYDGQTGEFLGFLLGEEDGMVGPTYLLFAEL